MGVGTEGDTAYSNRLECQDFVVSSGTRLTVTSVGCFFSQFSIAPFLPDPVLQHLDPSCQERKTEKVLNLASNQLPPKGHRWHLARTNNHSLLRIFRMK